MEVCVDCVESAVEANAGGASRLELCSSLTSGGLTPTLGLLNAVKKLINIPVFVMIRNREGDFNYSNNDLEVMKNDAKSLLECGVDGVVFGALNKDGTVDVEACKSLVDVCAPLPMTFHRAVDASKNLHESIQRIISLGFKRVLTSGGKHNASKGIKTVEDTNQ